MIRLLLQNVNSFTEFAWNHLFRIAGNECMRCYASTQTRLNNVFLFSKIIEKYLVINKYEGQSIPPLVGSFAESFNKNIGL